MAQTIDFDGPVIRTVVTRHGLLPIPLLCRHATLSITNARDGATAVLRILDP